MTAHQSTKAQAASEPSHALLRSLAADLSAHKEDAKAAAVLLQAPGGPGGELATILMLSALFSRLGRPKGALGWLHEACRRYPFELPETPQPGLARILRARSPRYGRIDLTGGPEAPELQLQIGRGHFSCEWLLDSDGYAMTCGNALGRYMAVTVQPPKFDLLLNTIACPDLHHADLVGLAEFLDRFPDIPTVNPPRLVLGTGRDQISARLAGIRGLIVPRTIRFKADASAEILAARLKADGLQPPLILRSVGSHTGRTLRRIENAKALRDALRHMPDGSEHYATRFTDYQNADGSWTKFRVFFISGEMHPVACVSSDSWNVHSGDRYRLMFVTPELRRRELDFLTDPYRFLGAGAVAALNTLPDVVGLDFFGADFSLLPSGEVVLFECNAAMRHNFDHAQSFPYTQKTLQRVSQAFQAMIQRKLHPQENTIG